MSLILKKCQICTHHTDIIDRVVTLTHFNNVIQVEILKSMSESKGHILMTDLFSSFTLGATTFFSHWVVDGQHGDGFGLPSNYV